LASEARLQLAPQPIASGIWAPGYAEHQSVVEPAAARAPTNTTTTWMAHALWPAMNSGSKGREITKNPVTATRRQKFTAKIRSPSPKAAAAQRIRGIAVKLPSRPAVRLT
jgi:ribonuclease I